MLTKLHLSRSWLLALGMLIASVLWLMSGNLNEPATAGADDPANQTESVPVVSVRLSQAESMTSELVLTGHTQAERQVAIKAETTGVIAEIIAARGRDVLTGDAILRFTVDERQARVLEARSRLEDVESRFNASSQLQSQNFQTETELARVKAELNGANAALQMAELELGRIDVRAPFSGVINDRYVESGDFVNRGQPLALLVDLDPIRVVANVSERYLGQISLGTEAQVRTLDGHLYSGRVSYLGRIANEVTRTIPVELEVPNPEQRLIEGITAELTLPVNQVTAHRIPLSILDLANDGSLGVKAVSGEGRVVFHPVSILGDSPDGVWIAGLPDRIRLITAGQAFVLPGQAVEVVIDPRETDTGESLL